MGSVLLHLSELYSTRNCSSWNREDAHHWVRAAAKKLIAKYDGDADLMHRVSELNCGSERGMI